MSAVASRESMTPLGQSGPAAASGEAPGEDLVIAGPDKFMLVLLVFSFIGLATMILGTSVVSLLSK